MFIEVTNKMGLTVLVNMDYVVSVWPMGKSCNLRFRDGIDIEYQGDEGKIVEQHEMEILETFDEIKAKLTSVSEE